MIGLDKAKVAFFEEWYLTQESHQTLMKAVFPEMNGVEKKIEKETIINLINNQVERIALISIYLTDFRKLVQGLTLSKAFNVTLPKRKPNKGKKVLYKDGFHIQQ